MYRQYPTLIVVILALSSTTGVLVSGMQSSDVDAIVARHYPTNRLEPTEAAARKSCHKVMATTPSGAPARIVAGYTDSNDGVLRVLQRDSSDLFHVVYESPADLRMWGWFCEIELADIDGDSVQDIFLRMAPARGELGWVFRSSPIGLQNLTPMSDLAKSSDLYSPGLVDLYHDGTLQIVSIGAMPTELNGRVTEAPALYRFRSGALVLESRPLMVRDSIRTPYSSCVAAPSSRS